MVSDTAEAWALVAQALAAEAGKTLDDLYQLLSSNGATRRMKLEKRNQL